MTETLSSGLSKGQAMLQRPLTEVLTWLEVTRAGLSQEEAERRLAILVPTP